MGQVTGYRALSSLAPHTQMRDAVNEENCLHTHTCPCAHSAALDSTCRTCGADRAGGRLGSRHSVVSGTFSKFLALRSLTSKDDSVWMCIDLCRYRGQTCGRGKGEEIGVEKGREGKREEDRGKKALGRNLAMDCQVTRYFQNCQIPLIQASFFLKLDSE